MTPVVLLIGAEPKAVVFNTDPHPNVGERDRAISNRGESFRALG